MPATRRLRHHFAPLVSGLLTACGGTDGANSPTNPVTAGPPLAIAAESGQTQGDWWTPITKDRMPRETWLTDQSFPATQRGSFPDLDTSTGSVWDSSKWAAGPFAVSLSDGSTLEYVWYRFIDQPAIARLGLDPDVVQRLQAFVEAWHADSGLAGVSVAPPAAGTLVPLDAAQFVTPPVGLEAG